MDKLEKIIKDIPSEFNGVFPFSPNRFHYKRITADDRKMALVIKDDIRRYKGFLLYIPLIISLLFSIYINWIVLKGAFLLVFAYILYCCIFGIKIKDFRAIVFDRENGTITYPVVNEGKIVNCSEKFQHATFFIQNMSDGIDSLCIYYSDDKEQNPIITDKEPYLTWSFLVWYMDSNRPLPMGKTFAPYRQRDFERRKKKGFPAPLYPSEIETEENPGY